MMDAKEIKSSSDFVRFLAEHYRMALESESVAREYVRGFSVLSEIDCPWDMSIDDFCALKSAAQHAVTALMHEQIHSSHRNGDTSGFVYFMKSKETGNLKIGFSIDPHERVKQVQGMSPSGIELLGYIKGTMKTESELHENFSSYHLRGEWFSASDEIIEFIESNSVMPN